MDVIDYKTKLSIVIRKARVASGLTQEEMAHQTQINATYYSKIERGESSVGIDKLESIAKILQMPLSKLLQMAEKFQH